MSLLDKAVVLSVPMIPKAIVRHFAGPYIAGEKLEDAVRVVQSLNRDGIMATIDVLGEAASTEEEIRRPIKQYIRVLDAIDQYKLDANISIKPTQFGLAISPELCLNNYRIILKHLRKSGNFLRVDMEDSPFTTLTLDLYESIRSEYENVGVVLQAYMRRSLKDLEERLIPAKTNFRLCKGIYVEPPEIAYKEYDVVRRNYVLLLRKALEAGLYVGIATHDELLIWEATRMIRELGLTPDQYEFQMLLGSQKNCDTRSLQTGIACVFMFHSGVTGIPIPPGG